MLSCTLGRYKCVTRPVIWAGHVSMNLRMIKFRISLRLWQEFRPLEASDNLKIQLGIRPTKTRRSIICIRIFLWNEWQCRFYTKKYHCSLKEFQREWNTTFTIPTGQGIRQWQNWFKKSLICDKISRLNQKQKFTVMQFCFVHGCVCPPSTLTASFDVQMRY